MPIDFAGIAALFTLKQQLMLKPIDEMFKRLGKWVARRLKAITAIEVASRRFPVVVFERGALAVSIDSSQRRALQLEEPPSLSESLASGGRSFMQGLGRISQAVEEERILPNLLEMIERIFRGILASVERFHEPTPQIFDPRRISASDMIGLTALFYRSIASSRGNIRSIVQGLGKSIALFRTSPEESQKIMGPPRQQAETQRGRSLPELLDMGARYILGAILILPTLPSYLGLLIRAGWIRVSTMVISHLQGIERHGFDLRRTIIDIFFTDLSNFIADGVRFLLAAELVVMLNLRFFIRFGFLYTKELLNSVIRFATELTKYMRFWTNLVAVFRLFLEALMNKDLMPFIVPMLGIPAVVLQRMGPLPRLTLGDILDASGDAVRISLKLSLTHFINALRVAVRLIPGGALLYWTIVKRKLDLAQEIVNQLFQSPAPYPDETACFNLPTSFPNIFDALFGPGVPDFGATLQRMAAGITGEVGQILNAGAEFLRRIGASFLAESRRAAQLGSPDQYRRLAMRAQDAAKLIFAGQLQELQSRLARRSDPLENAFVSWISRGGFYIVGRAIPLYVSEMRRFWQAQLREGTELTMIITDRPGHIPTSRHIIARRVRLGRVRMERLQIQAPGRQLNSETVNLVAERFKEAVQEGYVAGHGVIEQARAAVR